jgi:spore maturation protein CgeB
MKVVVFAHSLLSDWNHGNAHFLRGVASELQARGHDVRAFEPRDAWSVENLCLDHGEAALQATRGVYPFLHTERYDRAALDLEEAIDGAALVIVHEWNDRDLVRRIGRLRRAGRFLLLFHDTHHRSVSNPSEMAAYDLSEYDGVLAFGEAVRQRYLEAGWAARAWTWHEAADTRVFLPRHDVPKTRDLVWIGNWGDDERTAELTQFLIRPVSMLKLRATVHGVRYPPAAVAQLADAAIDYGGWLPNYRVPELFARHRVTVHIPRRPYVEALPGIPTIRPFEALACGIPLVSAPWEDAEGLFRPGQDFLVARTSGEMTRRLREVLNDPALAAALTASGLETIRARHTCAHRVDELLAIAGDLRPVPVERTMLT